MSELSLCTPFCAIYVRHGGLVGARRGANVLLTFAVRFAALTPRLLSSPNLFTSASGAESFKIFHDAPSRSEHRKCTRSDQSFLACASAGGKVPTGT
jgi:hypothetical protein